MILFLFVLIVFLLNQIGYFLFISVITNFFLSLAHYLSIALLVILIGFIAWCFSET